MQCNPQYIVCGPPNCSQFYSFNPPYPPPCSPPYPDIIGEGEVKSVVLADGTVQHYFLPTSKWSPPYLQNSNSLNCSPYCNPTTGAWFIRSVPNSPPCTPFVPQPYVFPRMNYTCNSPIALPSPPGVAMKFHNDNWTSTTDLQYFMPRMRKLMLTPQTCVGVQSDVNENSCSVCDNPCNCGPDCRKIRTPIFNGQVSSGAFPKQKENRCCSTKDATKITGVESDMSIDESKHSSKRSPANVICKCNSTTNDKPTNEQTRNKKSKSQSSISSARSTKSCDRKASISITCKCESEIRKTKQREEKLRLKTEKAEKRKEKELKTKEKEQSKQDKKRKHKEEGHNRNSLDQIQSSSNESDNTSNELSSSQASESNTSANSSGICICWNDRHSKGEDKEQKKLEKKQKESKKKSKKQEAKLQKLQNKEQRLEQESLSTESMTTTTSCSICSSCGDKSYRQYDSEKPRKTKKQMEKQKKEELRRLEKEQKDKEKQKKKELKRLEKEQKHKERSRKQSLIQEEKRSSRSQNHKLSSELVLCKCSEPEPNKPNGGKNLENSKSVMSVDELDNYCNFCTDCMELTDPNTRTRDVFSECAPPPTSDKLLATQNDQACSGIFGTFCGLDISCGCSIDINDTKLGIDKDSVEICAQPLTDANDIIQKVPNTPENFSTCISDCSKADTIQKTPNTPENFSTCISDCSKADTIQKTPNTPENFSTCISDCSKACIRSDKA